MRPAQTTTTRRSTFSLKWKTVILLSLVLVAINASFPLISYNNLYTLFEQERHNNRQAALHEFNSLLHQSSRFLLQTSELLPVLNSAGHLSSGKDLSALETTVTERWGMIRQSQAVNRLSLYNRDGKELVHLNDNHISGDESELTKLIKESIRTQKKSVVIECQQQCIKYAITPIVTAGRTEGAVVLGAAISDIIINFQTPTQADVGIIAVNNNAQHNDIKSWSAHIAALTNSARNIDILRKLASRHPALGSAPLIAELRHNGHYYEIMLTPLDHPLVDSRTYTIIITDITDDLARINSAGNQSIMMGIIGLILSGVALAALLWGPVVRLKRTAQTLPLLAKSDYKGVREIVKKPNEKRRWLDEIDVLDKSILDLSFQLEKLEGQVAQRTDSLAEKLKELASERDFVRQILNTAQTIIITLDKNGNITLINDYGKKLLGYSMSELKNTNFTTLIEDNGLLETYKNQLLETAAHHRTQFQFEGSTLTKEGTRRDITWFHSNLEVHNRSDVAVLSIGIDVTDRKSAESRLAWLANHDPLTGLANRRQIQEDLESAVALAKRSNHSGALLFIDIDQFKYINDTSGHHTGDYLLITIANKLTETLRETDTIARLGGDEFALLAPKVDKEGALHLAQKIQKGLDSVEFSAGQRRHKITASIGISMFPEVGHSAQELLAGADIAMYQAKEAGRSRAHFYSPVGETRQKLLADVDWKQRIEQALIEKRFVLVYQPIFNLQTDTISHYEVLLRMRDENGDLLRPGTFIEVAERCGLIRSIDHLVIRSAIKELAQLHDSGVDISFSVNLSAHAFNDSELLTILEEQLRTNGVPSSKLVFEITETAALADIVSARNLMIAIKGMGCRFALDDFGVGFSSFHYLKELPFDYIKIDGSFIRNLANNKDDQVLVKSLCYVANSFGKTVVAEFVQDDETIELLREYQVDLIQGYRIGKPQEELPGTATKAV